jgi:hypothetical protein
VTIGGRTITISVPSHPGKRHVNAGLLAAFALGFAVGVIVGRLKK